MALIWLDEDHLKKPMGPAFTRLGGEGGGVGASIQKMSTTVVFCLVQIFCFTLTKFVNDFCSRNSFFHPVVNTLRFARFMA